MFRYCGLCYYAIHKLYGFMLGVFCILIVIFKLTQSSLITPDGAFLQLHPPELCSYHYHCHRWLARLCTSLSLSSFAQGASWMLDPVRKQRSVCRFLFSSVQLALSKCGNNDAVETHL